MVYNLEAMLFHQRFLYLFITNSLFYRKQKYAYIYNYQYIPCFVENLNSTESYCALRSTSEDASEFFHLQSPLKLGQTVKTVKN